MNGRVRCYRGRNLSEALARLRSSMGEQAYVLGNRRRRRFLWFGPQVVEVMAIAGTPETKAQTPPAPVTASAASVTAPPAPVTAPPRPAGGTAAAAAAAASVAGRQDAALRAAPDASLGIQGALAELLAAATVMPELAARLARRALQGERRVLEVRQLVGALARAMADMTGGAAPVEVIPGTKRVVCFVGPAGAGKTTAVAKLACQLTLGEGRMVELINIDTLRPGAPDALARYAEILNIAHWTAYTPGELRRRIAASPADLVLVDTPGVNRRSADELAALAEHLESAGATEVHLVLPATTDAGQAEHLVAAWRPFGLDRLLLTRLDELDSYGPVVNLTCTARLPVSYLGSGGGIPDEFEAPDFAAIAEALLAGKAPSGRQDREVARVG
jgi:flagellar biosynthesis protein FlhF